MEQTFQYPNLLSGTRSGKGWTRAGSGAGGGYNPGTGIELYNSKTTEVFLHSPLVVLHKGVDYTLHCFAANTSNMSSTDIFVLDMQGGGSNYEWVGASLLGKNLGPGGGGRGSTGRSASIPTRGTAGPSGSASTTTAARTARTRSYGSATSCSWRARSRTHGHRQQGRCGLR